LTIPDLADMLMILQHTSLPTYKYRCVQGKGILDNRVEANQWNLLTFAVDSSVGWGETVLSDFTTALD